MKRLTRLFLSVVLGLLLAALFLPSLGRAEEPTKERCEEQRKFLAQSVDRLLKERVILQNLVMPTTDDLLRLSEHNREIEQVNRMVDDFNLRCASGRKV